MKLTKNRLTQEQRILKILRARGNNGVYAWEIMKDLNILQYNARIFGLRRKGYNIRNVKPGHFVLEGKVSHSRIEELKQIFSEKHIKTEQLEFV